MTDALACDQCGTVAVHGAALARRWIEVSRIGGQRRSGRRFLPPEHRPVVDVLLDGGRHFCSPSCARDWLVQSVEADSIPPPRPIVAEGTVVSRDDSPARAMGPSEDAGSADVTPTADVSPAAAAEDVATVAAADAPAAAASADGKAGDPTPDGAEEAVAGEGRQRLSELLKDRQPEVDLVKRAQSDLAVSGRGKLRNRFFPPS